MTIDCLEVNSWGAAALNTNTPDQRITNRGAYTKMSPLTTVAGYLLKHTNSRRTDSTGGCKGLINTAVLVSAACAIVKNAINMRAHWLRKFGLKIITLSFAGSVSMNLINLIRRWYAL